MYSVFFVIVFRLFFFLTRFYCYFRGMFASSTNRGGGRTILSRNGLATRSNKWSSDGSRLIRMPGDIVLGGIFPMHEHDINKPDYPCGMVKEEKGIQRLEAMMYALDQVNNNAELLPNITLGSLIIDSCSSDTYALEQSMEFVRYYMNQVIDIFRLFTVSLYPSLSISISISIIVKLHVKMCVQYVLYLYVSLYIALLHTPSAPRDCVSMDGYSISKIH